MTKQTKAVGVFGLGSMGFGIASNLVQAGHRTYGFDIRDEPVAKLRAKGGATGDFGDVAASLDVLVIVVLNAAQTESVLFGPTKAVEQLRPGTVVLSCATVSPDFARDMARRCAEMGVHYLDAPISGGAVGAANGTLSVLLAGASEAKAQAAPVLEAIAGTVFDLGDTAGPGSAMKAVNQMLVGIQIAATAEAMTFGLSQGVSADTFMEIIPKCAGTSWALEDRGPLIAAGDYEPRSVVDIWPKDLGIVLDIARQSAFAAPLTATALQQFLAAAGQGLGSEDDSAVAKVYARNAGLTLPGAE